MSALENTCVTPEQYLSRERRAEFQSEYYGGEVFPMAGSSLCHSLIGVNIVALLWNSLRGKDCSTFNSDMRVQVPRTTLYTYPDVIVVCVDLELLGKRQDVLLNPAVIVEVLFDLTELYDRTGKFEHYRRLPSLQNYLLVSQKTRRVEHYERQTSGQWLLTVSEGEEGTLEISSIGSTLANSDIYNKVVLEPGNALEITRCGLTEAAI